MATLTQDAPDVNPEPDWGDIIPFNGEVHPTEVRANETQLDRAARWGFAVYDALVGIGAHDLAGRAAVLVYRRMLNGHTDKLDLATAAVPAHEMEPEPSFWRGV